MAVVGSTIAILPLSILFLAVQLKGDPIDDGACSSAVQCTGIFGGGSCVSCPQREPNPNLSLSVELGTGWITGITNITRLAYSDCAMKAYPPDVINGCVHYFDRQCKSLSFGKKKKKEQ